MSVYSLPSFINILALMSAFVLMWRERRQFQALLQIRIAVGFLVFGRIVDLATTAFIGESNASLAWLPTLPNLLLSSIGNMSDAVGLLFLVYGFIKTIQYQREEEERIHNLETLLPLCAWCKNYRTETGDWKPIESYLKESGAPAVTHGICPDCAARRLDEQAKRRPKAGSAILNPKQNDNA